MAATTIDQLFAAKNLWQWYNSPSTQNYDGVSEKGMDYASTYGTPVAVPVGGTVKRIVHNNSSVGDVVELMDASGGVWLYQHITARVKTGQTLGAGSIVGTQNGLPIDQYSTGSHIEVRYAKPGTWNPAIDSWYEPWINPSATFKGLGTQAAGATTPSPVQALANILTGGTGGGAPGVGGSAVTVSIAPNADLTALLWSWDQILIINNPFNITSATTGSFTDVFTWLEQFGINLFDDLIAINARLIFIVIGVLILIKVSSAFIDYGAIGQTVAGGVSTVAKGAALLA